jgi:hypothetical protein
MPMRSILCPIATRSLARLDVFLRPLLLAFIIAAASHHATCCIGDEWLPPETDSQAGTAAPAQWVTPHPPHWVLSMPQPPKRSPGHTDEVVIYDEAASALQPQTSEASSTGHGHTKPHEKVTKHFLHADKTTRPPAIPNANRVPVWKTPYSYGHFGAGRNRQWSLHHGYQQTYTQWSLR